MSNAEKFITEGKTEVSVLLLNENKEKATIEFSVMGTGIGISQNDFEYL